MAIAFSSLSVAEGDFRFCKDWLVASEDQPYHRTTCVLSVGDEFEIYRTDGCSLEGPGPRVVSIDGTVRLGRLGQVRVVGRTTQEVVQMVERDAEPYFRHPEFLLVLYDRS